MTDEASFNAGSRMPDVDAMDPSQMAEAAAEASGLLRLLANTNRLMILCFLLERERSVGQMEEELGIRQPTLSQQIAILREARLIGQSRREAKVVYYELRDPKVIPVIRALYSVFCAGTDLDAPLAERVATSASPQSIDVPAPVSAAPKRAFADCGVMAVTDPE